MNAKELMTSHDAADLLGIKYETFRKRFRRDRLPIAPVAKVGGQWLWLRPDVERYRRMSEE